MTEWLMSNVLERMWKESVIWYCAGFAWKTEENDEGPWDSHSLGQDLNPGSPDLMQEF
jgi:hypothetical protein